MSLPVLCCDTLSEASTGHRRERAGLHGEGRRCGRWPDAGATSSQGGPRRCFGPGLWASGSFRAQGNRESHEQRAWLFLTAGPVGLTRGEASRPADSCRRRGASAVLTGPEGSRRGPHGETPGSGAGRGCAQLPGGWTEESRPWARRWLSPPPLRTPTLGVNVLDFTLLMKTPGPREIEQLAQGHTAGPRCGQDMATSAKAAAAENPSALWPEACHLQRRWLWCPGRLRALKPRHFPGR